VEAEPLEIAGRVRDLLRPYPPQQESVPAPSVMSPADEARIVRARRLRRFYTQPFYVAGPWIRWPAAFVPLADTLRGCRGILDGAFDHLPVAAFYMANGIEQVVERAGAGLA
jgi:F-type H+-transporting ATPase subunit beta